MMSNMQPQRGQGRGRHRAQNKSEEDKCLEMKAKGHKIDEETRKPGDIFERKDRGGKIQHGFGKNQGKEASDMTTDRGTRGAGGVH